jgi:hypothetical protein
MFIPTKAHVRYMNSPATLIFRNVRECNLTHSTKLRLLNNLAVSFCEYMPMQIHKNPKIMFTTPINNDVFVCLLRISNTSWIMPVIVKINANRTVTICMIRVSTDCLSFLE